MGPGVSYNNKHILTGVLEQLIPQFDLGENTERIKVGATGGVYFPVFDRRLIELPNSIDVTSIHRIGKAQEYFVMLQTFHRHVESVAQGHDLGMVTLDDKEVRGCAIDDYVYALGIGHPVVDNETQLRKFLTAVKQHAPEFAEFEQRLVVIGDKIRSPR